MPLVTSHSRRSDAGKPPQISRPNATKGSAKIEVADTCVIGTEAIEGPVVDIAESRANKQQTRRGGPPCPPLNCRVRTRADTAVRPYGIAPYTAALTRQFLSTA